MRRSEVSRGDTVRVVDSHYHHGGAVGQVKAVFEMCVDKHKGDYEWGASVKIDGRYVEIELADLAKADVVTRLGELSGDA